MRVVHVPYCFRPDPIGGTEVYVEALAREQQRMGLEVVIAAPAERDAENVDDGLRVRRFGTRADDLRDLYGEGDLRASQAFGSILDQERPDVVHLHAFTSGVSLRLAREARRRRTGLIFTYHTPTVSCLRGTLLRWGSDVCDGTLDLHTCARCTLHGLGAGRPASALLGGLPPSLGRLISGLRLSGGGWTAARMTELVELRHRAFLSLMQDVDCTVVPCGWARDLLLRNGVPAEKIMLSRHGLPPGSSNGSPERRRPSSTTGPLRITFLGRFDPSKGPDTLIRAIQALRGAPLELHLYGVAQGPSGMTYKHQLEQQVAGDQRIRFLPPTAHHGVVQLLHEYDLVAVPSRVLETGPLVVLEAFAAGTPVVGSNLGGIAELIEHDVNGLLVPTGSVADWQRALRRFLDEPTLLTRLRAGVRPPRSMETVAHEMQALYGAAERRREARTCAASA